MPVSGDGISLLMTEKTSSIMSNAVLSSLVLDKAECKNSSRSFLDDGTEDRRRVLLRVDTRLLGLLECEVSLVTGEMETSFVLPLGEAFHLEFLCSGSTSMVWWGGSPGALLFCNVVW